MNVLVTGGAGYVGSHAVKMLKRKNLQPIVIDNFVYGHEDFVQRLGVEYVRGNIGDKELVCNVLKKYSIDAVMHFSAYAYVGESVQDPSKYYNNNYLQTLHLLDSMVSCGVKKIIFSSTCATYGIPQTTPIDENHPQNPINPYGMSKFMVERTLLDYHKAYGLNSVIFRYFNAAGADPEGEIGEDHTPETHLIPLALLTALGKRKVLEIYGTDYPTQDGTCLRDYVHVDDLASAHILGLDYLENNDQPEFFNLGNGKGFSVKEIIRECETVTKKTLPVKFTHRREGDPAVLIADYTKATKVLGWTPKSDLSKIVLDAWRWTCKRESERKSI